jgi:hypothetical protein
MDLPTGQPTATSAPPLHPTGRNCTHGTSDADGTDWAISHSGSRSLQSRRLMCSGVCTASLLLKRAFGFVAAGATEVTSEQPQARRYPRTDQNSQRFSATRSYVVPGGCVSARFTASAAQQHLAGETSSMIGFTTRQELAQALSERSDGRLHLDPRTPS